MYTIDPLYLQVSNQPNLGWKYSGKRYLWEIRSNVFLAIIPQTVQLKQLSTQYFHCPDIIIINNTKVCKQMYTDYRKCVTFYCWTKAPRSKITYRRKSLSGFTVPEGWESTMGKHGSKGQEAGSSHPQPQAPSRHGNLEVGSVFTPSKPILNVFPPARPHILNLQKEHH